jgi:hypothetical protein
MQILRYPTGRDTLAEQPLCSCSVANIGKQRLESHGRPRLVRAAQMVPLLLL